MFCALQVNALLTIEYYSSSPIYIEYIKLSKQIEEHEALKADLNHPDHQKCLKHRKQEVVLLLP